MLWHSHDKKSQIVQDGPVGTGGDDKSPAARPLVGVAFGSGAARGWAHIGVIQRLCEAGIAPDVVAGTSVGALVGGCYAAGKLDELEEFARGLTRRRIFGLLDVAWKGSGFISGDRLTELLNTHLGGVTIETLPRPFACVATEIATGHEIWLRRGPLVESMRASYALPGVFRPVHLSERWLIDGALVNPIPVSVCRALGARIVIGINLNHDIYSTGTIIQSPRRGEPGHDEPMSREEKAGASNTMRNSVLRQVFGKPDNGPGITGVLVAAFNITQDRLARSRLAGDPPDLLISPRSGDIGLFDFDKAAASIALGREAAERALPFFDDALNVLS